MSLLIFVFFSSPVKQGLETEAVGRKVVTIPGEVIFVSISAKIVVISIAGKVVKWNTHAKNDIFIEKN